MEHLGMGPVEQVQIRAAVGGGELIVTDRRVVVVVNGRVAVTLAFDALRRIEFDLERGRPGTLILVPEGATDQPQVLEIFPEQYGPISDALSIIGRRLSGGPL